MSDNAALHRQLKIKTGVVQRLWKEYNLYQHEAEDQQRKLDKLIAGDGEEWYIKNGHKMLEEAQKMIPNSRDRLAQSVMDLRELVVSARGEEAFKEDADFKKAEEVLQEANL